MSTSHLSTYSMGCMVPRISHFLSEQCSLSKVGYQKTSTTTVSIQTQIVMIHPIYSSIYSYSSVAYLLSVYPLSSGCSSIYSPV